MDSALALRKLYDSGAGITKNEAVSLSGKSELIAKLVSEMQQTG